MAGLVLAQANAPGSYNFGTPAVPGTRTPESNPATAIQGPQAGSGGLTTPSTSSVGMTSPYATGGPASSFGAAPAPIGSSNR
jgi:hypothetical protein